MVYSVIFVGTDNIGYRCSYFQWFNTMQQKSNNTFRVLVSIFCAYLHKFIMEGIVFNSGKIFGAGYADVSVVIPYYRILMVILVVSGILTLFSV